MNSPKKIVRKIQRTNKGQWTITIPSVIAGMLELEIGEYFEISVVGNISDSTIKLKRVKN